jgi:hypothetical protein
MFVSFDVSSQSVDAATLRQLGESDGGLLRSASALPAANEAQPFLVLALKGRRRGCIARLR